MDSQFLIRLLLNVAIGAVVGLVAGVIIAMVSSYDNPFWAMGAGIFVGALVTPVLSPYAQNNRVPADRE